MTRDRSDRYADADEQYQQDPRWAAGRNEYAQADGYGPAGNYEASDEYGPSDGYQPADGYDPYDGYSAAAVRDAYARDAYARASGYAPADGNGAQGGYPDDPYAPAEEGYGYQDAGAEHDPYQQDHGYPGGGYAGDDQYGPGYGQDDPAGYPGQDGYPEQSPFRWQPGEDARRPEDPGEDPDDPSGYGGQSVRQMQPPPPRDEDEAPGWHHEPSREGFIPGLDDGRGSRRGRDRRRLGRVLAPLLALALLMAVSISGYVAYKKIHLHSADYPGSGTGHVTVQVMPGDTATSLAPVLVKDGVVASVNSFVAAAKNSTSKATLEPGFFTLHKHMKASLAYMLLLSPSARMQTVVTVPDGLRLTQILSLLQKKLGASLPANAFANAIKDTAALGLPPYANGNPEGYLFPATYDVPPGTGALAVLKLMVARYNQEAQTINLAGASQTGKIAEAHVIIVASILEAEGTPQYYSHIAEVIYNRLNQGMPLGLDSTVNYALNRFGASLTESQLQTNSPYNTFIHQGLPPGPIDSPSDAAIQAALHPLHGTDTYFVTVNLKTGLTLFTDSAAQFAQDKLVCHNNNAGC